LLLLPGPKDTKIEDEEGTDLDVTMGECEVGKLGDLTDLGDDAESTAEPCASRVRDLDRVLVLMLMFPLLLACSWVWI
jgi:hypothetical protein